MKVFTSKTLVKKITITLILMILFSFVFSTNVKAESIGGKLLKPVIDLVLSLGDGALNIVHKAILGQDITLFTISFSSTAWEIIKSIGVFVLIAVAAAITIVAAGWLVGALAALISGVTLSTVSIGTVLLVSVAAGTVGVTVYNSNAYSDKLELPVYSISPEEIFKNELAIFDVDFFNPQKTKIVYNDGSVEYTDNTNKQSIKDALDQGRAVKLESTAKQLRSTLSKWYQVLRNICLVLLLSVLVYIGIRILISSTSNDKAKYKQFLMDWVIAICLLFLMQYIMSFSNFFVKKITEVVTTINYQNDELQILEDEKGKISETLKKDYDYTDDQLEKIYVKDGNGNYVKNGNNKYIYWNTNLIGIARLNAQMNQNKSVAYAGYTMIFLVLVFYTIFFIFTYLKRVIYMAFLTLISPLVALTYPIDKMNDGKAQAFDMWFKEYIFNLLIQPMHLVLYTVLVSTAFDLALTNILYALVALGFIVPSEKLLRKFFGFEKAATPGMFAGPAGAAATMEIAKRLLGKPPHGHMDKGKNNNGEAGESSSDDKSKIKYKDVDNEALFGNNNENESIAPPNTRMDLDKGTEDSRQKNINAQQVPEEIARNDFGKGTAEAKQIEEPKSNNKIINGNKPINTNQSKSKRIKRAIGAGARYYGNGVKKKLKAKAKNTFNAKNIARKTGGLILGAAAGSVGLAAGIVSGDPSKAIKYAAGAAVGGYKFGDGATKTAIDTVGVDGTFDYMTQNYYGKDEYNEKKIKDNTRAFQNNFENKEYIRNKFNGNKEKMSRFMNEVVPMCQEYGLTDMKDAETVWDMKEDPSVKASDEQIINAVQISKERDTTNLSAKDDKEFNETLKMRAKGNEKVATNARNLIDRASQTRYGHTRKK